MLLFQNWAHTDRNTDLDATGIIQQWLSLVSLKFCEDISCKKYQYLRNITAENFNRFMIRFRKLLRKCILWFYFKSNTIQKDNFLKKKKNIFLTWLNVIFVILFLSFYNFKKKS